MSNADHDYFTRRREESLARADRATDPSIAKLHRQFASHYDRHLAERARPAPVARFAEPA